MRVLAPAALVVVLAAGCGSSKEKPSLAALYDGVSVGTPASDVRSEFGEPGWSSSGRYKATTVRCWFYPGDRPRLITFCFSRGRVISKNYGP